MQSKFIHTVSLKCVWILKLHLWFFTGIGFIVCIFNIRPAEIFRVRFKILWLFLSVTSGTTIHCLLLESFAENLLGQPSPHSILSFQVSDVLMSRGSFCESSTTVKVVTLLLQETGKQRVCSFSPSWLLCLSHWEAANLWSFSLLRLRAHLWSIRASEHGRVPAIWMWPSANGLHHHTSPWKSCLEHCIPLRLTWLHLLSPYFGTRPLRAHIRHSVFTEILFLLQQLLWLIIILGASYSQLRHLRNLTAWHCVSDITVCCHGKCHQFSTMTSPPEGEDALRETTFV